MKKKKLNLDKKAIAKLSNESLDNIQGGGLTKSCICSIGCNCTTGNTTEAPDEDGASGGLSCN